MFWCVLRFLTDLKKCIKETVLRFCVKNKIKCARPFKMLAMAFGKSTMNRTQVQLRYNGFKEGREDVNDNARPGRRKH